MTIFHKIRFFAIVASAMAVVSADAVTFTTDTTIDVTNATYDGQAIVVSGCTLTVNGTHSFASFEAMTGAILTHQAATTNETYSLQLAITGALVVDATSKIDVTALGYEPGYTVGNTTNGGATKTAGGSYGGAGGTCCGSILNAVYGDYRNPNDLGSGSGNYSTGAAGGGLVRITAGSAQINGEILANGGGNYDGGSGGGIYLSVGALTGTGTIMAAGGAGNSNDGGGGGRVAIYYTSDSGFNLTNNVSAIGGSGAEASGSAGTVYLQQSGQLGELLINNHGAGPGGLTPLGASTDTVFQVDNLVIVGSNTVAATVAGAPIQANSVTVAAGAVLTQPATTTNQAYSLQLTITNGLVVDHTSEINVTALGYLEGYTQGNTTEGGATFLAGGSYGGSGNFFQGSVANAVYGDYHNPNDLGSGSGTYGQSGSGGGLVRITAGSAQVDGQILANGETSYNGGSGGGIYLNVGSLSGGGTISANGGSANGNDGGGGGRVAVLYTTVSGFDLTNNVTAIGGSGPSGAGSAGTVFLQQTGQLGELLINNNGAGTSGPTPLGALTDTAFQVDNLVIVGSNTIAATVAGAPIQANSVTVADGAVLTHQAATTNQAFSLEMTITNNFVLDATSQVNVTALGYQPGYTVGNTTKGGATKTAGGTYGGVGAICCDSTNNAVYGDYRNPDDLGSGSGNYSTGAPGGGLVRITAGSAQINGEILANGGGSYDGGSGGGIYLSVGALTGTGTIMANGGAGNSNDGGGGGRVAIYYTSASSFNLTNNVNAIGGAGPTGNGSAGTVYLQQSGQPGELLINNNGAGPSGLTPLGALTDTAFQVDNLVIVGSNTIAATVAGAPIQANSVTILGGGNLTHLAATIDNTYSLRLTIASNLMIDATSAINVSGKGYLVGHTVGNVTGGASSFVAGGSYGGLGGSCCGDPANAVYGNYKNPDDLGSGSGPYGNGAPGGGLVRITANSALINGAILANGGNAYEGGSGGGILVNVAVLNGAGTIAANGGNATGNDGGGGGRVAIYAWAAQNMPQNNITANGGSGIYVNGQPGSAYIASTPYFNWGNNPQLWHGTEPIAWQSLGGNPGSTVEVTITRDGTNYFDEFGDVGPGFINWDTTTAPDGIYVITANFINPSGQALGQLWQDAAVNNSAIYHSGLIASDETWGAGTVNVVDGNVTIPDGVTVTIDPGAVIKVANGFQIIVQAGGTFDASGATSASPIILTSLSDSSVGGDTLEVSISSAPQPGDWSGVVTSGGRFLQNQYVDLRYAQYNLGGTLSSSQTLSGTYLYIVNSPVIVPTGVTLTIAPGTVIKFDLGMNMTVETGGNLVARGSVAQPIIFTSINDDSIGGSRNAGVTPPAPGDWDSIYIGGTATFDHVVASYGASQNLPAGLITSTNEGAIVSVSDSIVKQGLYDGIQAAAGNVTITNCVVTSCDRGIQTGLLGNAVVTIVNCTLDNNNYGIFFHGATASVANTIVANSLQGGIANCCGSSVTAFQYNDVWAPNGINYNNPTWPYPDPTRTMGNISVNPNFINETNGDYQLNYLSPCIDAANSLVALRADLAGDPRYNDPRTITKTGVPNAGGVYADIGAYEFVENAPSPVDLVPTTVNGPTSVNAGDQVTITWSAVNNGTGPAVGPWRDTLSLFALDGSSNVIPVATELVEQSSTLGPSQGYTESVTVRVPSAPEGNYLWQVHVNSSGDIFEGQNVANNVTNAKVATSLTLPALPVDGSLSSTFASTGQRDLYKISPGAGQDLIITLQDNVPGSGVELYLAEGRPPTVSQFDYKSSQFNTNIVSLTVPNTVGGEYYVLAYARSLNAPSATYTISASLVTQFGVSAVSPGEITDNGPVTLQLNGGLLAGNDTYQLVGPGGAFAASGVVGSNPNSAFVTFNLNGAASGSYSLVVTEPSGQSFTNLNAVQVTNAAALPQFSVQLQVPSIYRVGRAFNGLIVYGNIGNADMPAPILILTAGGIADLQLLPTDSYSNADLLVVAAAMEGPAGVLRPGQTYSIPFSASPNAPDTIPFQVDYKSAYSTDAVDYVSLSSRYRPPGYTDDDWNAVWSSFQTAAGPTWGGFVQLVDHYATIMAEEPGSGTFYSLPDVLAYAFADQLAQNETSVAGTLYLGDTNHPLAQTLLSISDPNYDTGVAESLVDGTFRMLSLTSGVYSVSVPGYWLPTQQFITIPETGGVTNVNIIVRRGATIEGVVYDQFGVLFLTNVNVEASSATTNAVFDTTTGSDGSYTLSGLPPDTYTVTAGAGSYPIQQIVALSVSDDQTWNTNFFLFSGATVKAQVFVNNLPLEGAVAYFTDTNNNLTSAVSDTSGQIDISGLAAGSWTIQIQANGYASYTVQTNLLAGQTLQLGKISLVTGATIVTVLYNAATQIVSEADLSLFQNGTLIGQQYADSNGVAVFSNLDPGTYQLTGTEAGYPSLSNNISVSLGATITNIVHLTVLGSITGLVSDANGKPLSGLGVNVFGLDTNNQSVVYGVLTGSDGNYVLNGLTAGRYLVTVGNNGGILEQQVTISSSLPTVTANFVLRDTVIRGVVLNSDGVTPLGGATALLSEGDQLVATAVADTNGAYVFRVLLPGTYSLSAGSASVGLTPRRSIVVPANTNLEAAGLIIGSTRLSGVVHNGSGAPLPGASVILSLNDGGSAAANFVATAGGDGQFSVTGLIPGSYTLEVRNSGFATVMQTIAITGNTTRTFVLTADAVAQGAVVGAAAENATVSFFDPATKFPVAIIPTDASGGYSLSNMALANYDVIVDDGVHQIKQLANVSLNANTFTLNVALAAPNTSLNGTITDVGANPVSGASINIVDSTTGETLASVTTSPDGAWSTSQLPPGNYAVSIVAMGYLPPSSTNISLAANFPQVLNSIVTPAATDDAFTWTSGEIGNFLLAAFNLTLPVPNAVLQAPAPACSCANGAWIDYQKSVAKRDFTFDMWDQAFNNVANIGGASTGVAGSHLLRLVADGLAAFSPYGKAAEVSKEISAMSESGKTTVFALQSATLLADQWQGIQTLLTANLHSMSEIEWSKPASVQEGFNAIAGSFADLTAVSIDVHHVTGLVATLNAAHSHYVPGSKADVALDGAVLLLDLFVAVNDFKEGVDAVKEAQENYKDAYQDYLHALHALVVANSECNNCPPPATPPPPPPNPTPGQTNSSNPGGANDPNDKLTTGTGQAGFVRPGEPIDYSVLFENQPTATLPAQEVVITDQLDPSLNWATLQLGAIGFNNVTIEVPPGVQIFSTNVYVTTDPNPVQVNGSLDINSGLLTWVIQSINPLTGQPVSDPLAGFLPPDKTNGVGEGYVSYSVSSQTNAANDTVIYNQANIVFDANAAILTPTTTNTIDSALPQSSVLPLPASATNTQFVIRWSGTDYGGSGVATYNVYIATNNGSFALWLFDTTNTSEIFTGQLFDRYSFYSVAVDNVGNIQTAPTKAQATTTIADVITLGLSIPNAVVAVNNEVFVDAGETVTFLAAGRDQYDLPLTYRWSFGDGTSTGLLATNTIEHTYNSGHFGTYEASVTASNGYISVTRELTVVAAAPLKINKATLDADFAKANSDSMALTATMNLQGLTNVSQLANLLVNMEVGGAQVQFTLNNKGTATSVYGTCKLSYTGPTKTLAGFWTLTATLAHGEWHYAWAGFGMIDATIPKPGTTITLPVAVLIGVQAFATDQPLDYTATLNKTGSAVRDLTKPTLSIKSPLTGQRLTNATVTVTGKASDLVAVESVFYNLNNTGWNSADTTNKWATWTVPTTLKPGTNTVSAYAVDTSDNVSRTNMVKFVYVVAAELTVRTNGSGSINPSYNDKFLDIGANYSMTAKPKVGWQFTNWTDAVGQVITNKPTVKFVMESNLTFVANFWQLPRAKLATTAPDGLKNMTNARGDAKGVANGNPLELAITKVTPLKEGVLEFTLQVSAAVSGHIQYSTNLTSWTTLTNFVGADSTVIFRDQAASNSSQRYYRAVVP